MGVNRLTADQDAVTSANIRRFGERAAGYGKGIERPDLDLLTEIAGDLDGKALLDTAAGKGACAVRMAARGAEIYQADITHAMLTEGMREIEGRRLPRRSVVAHNGWLPFADACFDVVTCARAYHHMEGIRDVLLEARRVLRETGRLLVADHSGPDHPEAIGLLNAITRIRDDSHVRTYSPSEWKRMLAGAGFKVEVLHLLESRQDLADIIEASGDMASRVEEMISEAPEQVLQALDFDASASAHFRTSMVVFAASAE